MTRRTRWLGLGAAFALGVAVLGPSASSLPVGSPKLGMVCAPGSTSGSVHTFNLTATTGHIQTPDGNSVFMWSYADADDPDPNLSQFQFPGPVLCVAQGQTVVVNLTNTLPEASSIVFPGQEAVTATGGSSGLLTTEAAASSGSVSYSFVAASPGTYLYESGSNVTKQVEMGLYGALVVRPAGHADWAYTGATQFNPNREFLLLLSDIDPDLHHAVETNGEYDINALHNRYFAVNGRSFPDTLQDNGSALLPNQPYGALVRIQPFNAATNPQPTLIRMINAGALNHPFHPHGNHTSQIAQDGRLLTSPGGASASTEHFGETIGSGQTQDYLLKWEDQDLWSPTGNPLPVAQPNYRNLTFKDGNTYYSGSPYLGYKGTLPTGTTSQNVCGEWYFPLHSHALDEFTNFDEGFGGMATLLRVDPPGGCTAVPTSTTIQTGGGTLRGGSFSALALSDNVYYQVNSTTTGVRTTDWYARFSSVPTGSTNLTVTYEGHDNSATADTSGTFSQTLSLWNWTTNSWVSLQATPTTMTTVDQTVSFVAPAPQARFIGTGASKGQVRVRVLTTRSNPVNFYTSGDFMKVTYDAP